MDKLLASLTYSYDGVGSHNFVTAEGSGNEDMGLMAIDNNGIYALSVADGDAMIIVYATKDFATPPDFPPLSAKQGWNNLTDGLYRFANVPYQTNDSIDTADGWNGILIGAVVYK